MKGGKKQTLKESEVYGMYRWQIEQQRKNDPFYQMIDVDRDLPKGYLPVDQLQYTSVMGSMAHTYGNVLAFMEKWILDLFPPDTFRTIHISSKLAHRQMIQSDLRQQSKKINPKIIFRPRIAGTDEDRFLKGTQLIERQTNSMAMWGGTNLQPFFIDNQRNFEIRYQMNRSVMYVDVACVFSTLLQQINYEHYLENRIPIGHPTKLETCLESYLPKDLINTLSNLIELPVVDDEGCTKAFMEYLNGHSKFPITYKLSGATGNREFYRYYPCNVEVLLSDIMMDEGEKTGQTMGSYQMTFTVRLEFESTGFYYLFGYELDKFKVPDVSNHPELNTSEVIPVFTDIMMKEDLNLKPGWHLYNQASCRLEEVNDHINIGELFNSSIKRCIEYHHKNGLPCVEFLDIKVRRQGELLTEGKDYYIDYQTLDLYFYNQTVYYTYKILTNINVGYINEMVKEIYNLP